MIESRFFKSREIYKDTYQIRGTCGDNAYLLIGRDGALLIDTTMGAGNLRDYVGFLTDLPVYVALTHGHGDHSGGVFDFGECYMHPDDIRMLYDDTSVGHRKEHIDNCNGGKSFVTWKDFTPPSPVRTYPIYDGSRFDLGDRFLSVVHVQGHSRGSVVFVEEAARTAFTGDACNTNTLLYLGGCSSIAQYRKALEHLSGFKASFDLMWGGHGDEAMLPCSIDDAIGLCGRILAGTDDHEEAGCWKAPFYRARKQTDMVKTGCQANIVYRPDWIHAVPEEVYVNVRKYPGI